MLVRKRDGQTGKYLSVGPAVRPSRVVELARGEPTPGGTSVTG